MQIETNYDNEALSFHASETRKCFSICLNIYTRKLQVCTLLCPEWLNSYRNIFFSRYWYIGADNGTSTVDIVET
jgi:hypothetical protein